MDLVGVVIMLRKLMAAFAIMVVVILSLFWLGDYIIRKEDQAELEGKVFIPPQYFLKAAYFFGLLPSSSLNERGEPYLVWSFPNTPHEYALIETDIVLGHGADINAASPNGITALMEAASREWGDVVAYLLKRGANPHLRSESGTTALFKLHRNFFDEEEGKQVIQLLLEAGADPCLRDSGGEKVILKYGPDTRAGRIIWQACQQKEALNSDGR
jgi:hypothetical protein